MQSSKTESRKIQNMNKLNTNNKIELLIIKKQINKSPGPESFTDKSHQTCKEKLMSIILKLFQKIEDEGMFLNSLY